jgi:hypothetical protein
MPIINGITASISTHDGQLEEFEVDEFPGGVSCYITAHSGQQFWLNYDIQHPIRAKAVSVEFHVDGHRVDTQFPLAPEGDGPVSVGPVQSSITSQYRKDETGNVYRRDVFFTLVDKVHQSRNPRRVDSKSSGYTEKAGTIECKVYRAEKTGEWDGAISPEDFSTVGQGAGGSVRPKGVSHRARLGANIPAAKTTRYTFRNLDPEDAPFAFFRFYYRSKKFIQRIRGPWPLSRPSSPIQLPRPFSRNLTRGSSLYQSISKGKGFITEKLITPSRLGELSDSKRATTPKPILTKSPTADSTVESIIERLCMEGKLQKDVTESTHVDRVMTDPKDAERAVEEHLDITETV